MPIKKGKSEGITLFTHSIKPVCALSYDDFEKHTSKNKKNDKSKGKIYRFIRNTLNSNLDAGSKRKTKHKIKNISKYNI